MTVQQPKINITFEQLASSFIARSSRGSAVLIIKDDTDITFTQKIYKDITLLEADVALYTPENLQYIKDTMVGLPSQTVVIRVGVSATFASGLTLAEPLKTGWIGFVSEVPADYDMLATWNKEMKANDYTFMSLEYKPTTPTDSQNCHVLINDTVVFNDARGEVTLEKIIPTMLGYCAGSNVESGLTYKVIENLVSVKEVADIDASLLAGNLVLTNDEGVVKIVLGINSLTTLTDKITEDFKFIEVIEINNLIHDDFRKQFKLWIGSHKNIYDQQVILISEFNTYLDTLADSDILDKNYANKVEIDIVAQRKAWVAVNPLAVDWDETTVRNTAFKRQLFLMGNIKELQSMTDMDLNMNLV